MSRMDKYVNVWRAAVLVLLLVALAGPCTYTSDGVPPAAWCREPNILLDNDRCARPVSGASVLVFWAGAFFRMSAGLVTGATDLSDRALEFLAVFLYGVLFSLLLSPIVTTLLVIWRRGSRRLGVCHRVAWGLAAVLSMLPVVFDPVLRSGRFWGVWLYMGTAASALSLELFVAIARWRPSQR